MDEIPEREIPEDIMQAVGKALGPADVRVNRGIYAATCLRVAWALMAEREAATKAERERCKAEAEKVQDRDLLGASSDYSAGHFVACGRILAAIRSGARP